MKQEPSSYAVRCSYSHNWLKTTIHVAATMMLIILHRSSSLQLGDMGVPLQIFNAKHLIALLFIKRVHNYLLSEQSNQHVVQSCFLLFLLCCVLLDLFHCSQPNIGNSGNLCCSPVKLASHTHYFTSYYFHIPFSISELKINPHKLQSSSADLFV